MMVQETSSESYKELHKTNLESRQNEVLIGLVKYGPCTDLELCHRMKKTDPNYVRPRRNELVKMGKVRMVNKRQCTISGKMSMVFRVVI